MGLFGLKIALKYVGGSQMDHYQQMIRGQKKWLQGMILIMIIGTVLTLGQRTWLGLLLGSLASYTNLWLLQRHINQIAEVAMGYRRFATAGTISRIGSALLVVALAWRYDAYINFFAVVMGLMLKYVVILLEAFVRLKTGSLK